MIRTGPDGRRRSDRTAGEDAVAVREALATLPAEARTLFQALIEEADGAQAAQLGQELEEGLYHTVPVPMAQFLDDPYYLGESMTTLYPEIRQVLLDMFAAPYREVLLAGGIGYGKCVDGDTELYDPIAGRRVTVREASLGSLGAVAWDGEGAVPASARAAQSGWKPLGWLTMRSGVRVRMSADHPVLTPWGFAPAASLPPGSLVASLRRMPPPVRPLDIGDDEVTWIAYMLADGGTTQAAMTFTNADPRLHAEFERVTVALGKEGTRQAGCRWVQQDGKAWTVRPRGVAWLQRKYSMAASARAKRVPASFYGLSDRQLGLFLNRVWACDGWVSRHLGGWEVGISLASEAFIRDIQQLLLRFGIRARTRSRTMHYRHKGERRSRPAWSLELHDCGSVRRFLEAVGDVRGKEDVCRVAREELRGVVGNPNVDVTPLDGEARRILRREIGPIRRGAWWPSAPRHQRTGHGTFVRLRAEYALPAWCRWWADVFWDEVVSYHPGTVAEPVYDVEVPSHANFTPQGMIVHNTLMCSVALCRIIYELSCLKNPQLTLGIGAGTELAVMLVSKSLPLCREVLKTAVDDKIKLSPYFMGKFAPKFSTDFTLFPSNIRLTVGSYGAERALGKAVIAAALDESNFPPKRNAQQIQQTLGKEMTAAHFDIVERVYRSLVRRIKSRFQRVGGDLPGMVILASSAATLDSFTERKIREAAGDPDVYVVEHSQWSARPAEFFCGDTFHVLCSRSSLRSRILEPAEYAALDEEYLEEHEAWAIEVPVEYRDDFEGNLEDSLRDIAGVSTQAISAFFQRVEAIDACVAPDRTHPFTSEAWVAGTPGGWDWDLLCRPVTRRLPGGFTEEAWLPREAPSVPRWIHIDVSTSGDNTGFCLGHIARWVEVVRRDHDGNRYTDMAPHFVIDAILAIRPPPGEQIYLPDLRNLVYALQAHGFPIAGVSTDTYMWVEMHQQLRRHGVHAELLSLDRSMDGFNALKSAIYERRIEYYAYPLLLQELKALEYDRTKGKVDHTRHSTKDLSDACAGVVWGLTLRAARLPWAADPATPRGVGSHEHQWVSPLVPLEEVDVGEVRAARQQQGDHLPLILFGDED